jgi:hypothetical protein
LACAASEAVAHERGEPNVPPPSRISGGFQLYTPPPSASTTDGGFDLSATQLGIAAAMGAVVGASAALAVRGTAALGPGLGLLLVIETALPTAELLVLVGAYYFLPDEPPEDPNPAMPEDETGRRLRGLGFAAGSRLGVR